MHYYQHHIGDFIRDTSRLTDQQCMAYMRLIWMYYESEQPLPNEIDVIAMRVGCTESDASLILRAFFKRDGDVWRHTRCDKEIAAYHQMHDAASKAGKASAAKRALNKQPTDVEQPLSERSADVEQASNERAANGQLTNNQQPITNNQYLEGFDQFWSVYPKKVSKPAALKAFKAAKINGHLPEVIADIEAKKESEGWKKNGGQYIPNPSTYLNNRKWEDGAEEQPSGIIAGAI